MRFSPIKNSGFSLMELFFVLAIIGIMLTATIMYFSSLSRNEDIASALQEVRAIMQAGAVYINTHGNYAPYAVATRSTDPSKGGTDYMNPGFTVDFVKEANLIEPKYNFTFSTTTGTTSTTFLALPWTDEAQGTAGVTIISGDKYLETYGDTYSDLKDKMLIPSQQYVLRFTAVPAWVCQTLSQQMQLVATQLTFCKTGEGATETPTLDFILPKLSD